MNTREDLIETMARAMHADVDGGGWDRENADLRDAWRRSATAALAAIEAAGARVVPVEMTEAMRNAALALPPQVMTLSLRAAITASPFAPPQPPVVESGKCVDRSDPLWSALFNAIPATTTDGRSIIYSRRAAMADAAWRDAATAPPHQEGK